MEHLQEIKIIEATGTANSHYINRATQALTNGIDYNISVYLKQSERTNVRIASNIAGVTQDCYLDLTNGSVSSNTFTNTPIVTAEANGWYRFSVTITSGTASSTFPLSINLLNASNQLIYSGDGISGCYVWGFQLSQTSSVKTYQRQLQQLEVMVLLQRGMTKVVMQKIQHNQQQRINQE